MAGTQKKPGNGVVREPQPKGYRNFASYWVFRIIYYICVRRPPPTIRHFSFNANERTLYSAWWPVEGFFFLKK